MPVYRSVDLSIALSLSLSLSLDLFLSLSLVERKEAYRGIEKTVEDPEDLKTQLLMITLSFNAIRTYTLACSRKFWS
jgi:hypothetical protein